MHCSMHADELSSGTEREVTLHTKQQYKLPNTCVCSARGEYQ